MNIDPGQRHDTIATVFLAAVVGLAVLAALLSALLDAIGHPLLVGLVLTVAAVTAATIRRAVHFARERREDAADALAGAAWRAEHMPHLAAQIDRHSDRVGVR
jgi:Flp pilus assembly protein TadB